MLADYAGITLPAFLLLNMSDVAAEQGKSIDAKAISQKLGIPVVLFSAQDRKNYKGFYDALEEAVNKKTVLNSSALEEKYEKIEAYKNVKALVLVLFLRCWALYLVLRWYSACWKKLV